MKHHITDCQTVSQTHIAQGFKHRDLNLNTQLQTFSFTEDLNVRLPVSQLWSNTGTPTELTVDYYAVPGKPICRSHDIWNYLMSSLKRT